MQEKTGGCLCGAIRFRATPKKEACVDVCHCGMCRKQTGGPLFAIDCEGPIVIEDETQLGVYASSDWGERGFCKKCGTNLFWRMRDGSMTNIIAGAFDDTSDMEMGKQIFIDEKPDYYDFAQDTPKMTGQEVVAAFLAEGDKS